MVLDCTIIFLSCWSKLNFSVYKLYKFGWKSSAQKGVYQQIISLSPTTMSSLFSLLPWSSKKCRGIQLSPLFSLVDVTEHLVTYQASQSNVGISADSLLTSGCNFFSHIEQGFLFFPPRFLTIQSHELSSVAQVIMWQLRQQSQVSLSQALTPASLTHGSKHYHTGAVCNPVIKKCSPPKKPQTLASLSFSWGKKVESPRLLY